MATITEAQLTACISQQAGTSKFTFKSINSQFNKKAV